MNPKRRDTVTDKIKKLQGDYATELDRIKLNRDKWLDVFARTRARLYDAGQLTSFALDDLKRAECRLWDKFMRDQATIDSFYQREE